MHICSRVSHSICANFAQFFGTWKIQLIVCCGFPCECTFSMLYLFISALRNAHWLSIYRAYTRTHTHTPDTTRFYVVWFLYSTIYFIWGRLHLSRIEVRLSSDCPITGNRINWRGRRRRRAKTTKDVSKTSQKERGATVDCVCVFSFAFYVNFLLIPFLPFIFSILAPR